MYGWRMTFYSLAHARAERMCDNTRLHVGSFGLSLVQRWRPEGACCHHGWCFLGAPHSHAIRLGVGEQVGVLSVVWPGRAVVPLHLLQVPSPCTGVPRVGVRATMPERGRQHAARIPCLIMGQAYVETMNDFSAVRSFVLMTRRR